MSHFGQRGDYRIVYWREWGLEKSQDHSPRPNPVFILQAPADAQPKVQAQSTAGPRCPKRVRGWMYPHPCPWVHHKITQIFVNISASLKPCQNQFSFLLFYISLFLCCHSYYDCQVLIKHIQLRITSNPTKQYCWNRRPHGNFLPASPNFEWRPALENYLGARRIAARSISVVECVRNSAPRPCSWYLSISHFSLATPTSPDPCPETFLSECR